MASRGKGWLLSLGLALITVILLRQNEANRGASTVLGLLLLAILGLLVEAFAARKLLWEKEKRPTPCDHRAADGVVEVVKLSGVESEPNRVDPTFRRFLRRDHTGEERVRPRDSSSPPMLGRLVLISVFVGRDGRPWTDSEVARGHKGLRTAGLWIEREAARLHAPVNVGLADTYFHFEAASDEPVEMAFVAEAGDFGPLEADAATRYLIDASRAALELGFQDVTTMMGWVDSRIDADATAWVFHQKRAGRSLAIAGSDSDLPGVGLAVCFAKEASFPEPISGPAVVDPLSVVHEVLHLFGASDKYGVPLQTYPSGHVTTRDIMRLQQRSLARMRVDPLTAAEIGWPESDSPKKARRKP